MRLNIAILAAGQSLRLGVPKQLVSVGNKPLLQNAIDEVESVKSVFCSTAIKIKSYCLLGASASDIKSQMNFNSTSIIENPFWSEGIASSIRKASTLAKLDNASALMFVTCDQWRLKCSDYTKLIRVWQGLADDLSDDIVVADYGTIGIPAIFPSYWFNDLASLTGDVGARTIINAQMNHIVACQLPHARFDIDTQQQLAQAQMAAHSNQTL